MKAFFLKLRQKISDGMFREMYYEIQWVYGYAHGYWREIILYMALGVLATLMGLANSIASMQLINTVTKVQTGDIAKIAAIYVGLGVFSIVFRAFSSRIGTRVSLKVKNEIQADIYDKMMGADWQNLSQYHSGDLLNRLNGDMGTVSDSVLGLLPEFVTKTVQFVGALAIILYYDPIMATIALISAPVTLIFSRILMKRMREYSRRMREVSSELMSFQEESFQNVQSVKSFGLTKLFGKRMRNVQQNYKDMALEYNRFSVLTSTLMSFMGMAVSYICFGWGVYRLWTNYINYGQMVLFIQLAHSLSGTFSALIGIVPSIISTTTAARRVMSIVELPQEDVETDEEAKEFAEKLNGNGASLNIKNVNFSYITGGQVLHDVSMKARRHEIVALVGPSGEGKTTVLRLLLGLMEPTSGEISIQLNNGETIPLSPKTRQLFSYVPQGNSVFSGTILENLRMVNPEATEEEVIEALKLACAYKFVEKLPDGIHSVIGERGVGFSEGQAQRISIARALLRNAPILLFDEATSALDEETEQNVLKNIMESGLDRTCIVTTHRPSVLRICDRVYKVSGGKIEAVEREESLRMAGAREE